MWFYVADTCCRGTGFALLTVMLNRRDGPPDRRTSRRGGRRSTDTVRSDVDALRVQWEELESACGSPATAQRQSDDDTMPAAQARYGNVRRSRIPPRK
jgi:hypothetical protein